MFDIKEVILEEERQELIHFLHENHLDYEQDITYSIFVYDADEIVATASLAHNIIKCIVVDKNYQGKQITNLMFRYLVNILEDKGIFHYFVYTKPENEDIFLSLSMTRIVKTMNSVLLEGGDTIDNILAGLKEEYNITTTQNGCVIINANPMTLGHLYLIETAAKKENHLLVFVVSEDLSSFPFQHRFNIIKKAVAHLENVTVLPTLSYLVSRITFPKYFLKEDQLIKAEQTLIDVLVYKEYYKEIFSIKHRYLGEEPFSATTDKYNQVLQDYMPKHIKIIQRKEVDDRVISASFVRKLIKANKIKKTKEFVPQATYDYLQSEKGQHVIQTIQNKALGRH